MKHLSPFQVFESVSYVPSHEELSQLSEFKRMKWCNPEWTTGKRAYDNGTRKIRFDFDSPTGRYTFDGISGFDSEYSIYPHKGSVSDGNHTIMRGLKFDTLEDWNESLLQINGYLLAIALYNFTPGSNRVPFVRALKGNGKIKNGETLAKIIKHPESFQALKKIIFEVYDVSTLIEEIENLDVSLQIEIIKHLTPDKKEEAQKKLGFSDKTVQNLSDLADIGFFEY